ncbi:hypothetical protein Aca07nite_77350 [Actinoplanes capillaceus]|uniref:Uncharacterized protein n=1 Tax=Actinoplanes campanulatus TaxID=113559 RepID=A0ABQ3WWE4_9ACTN|nr:hypothetical protein [Actinoplanes capillaceus]GID50460.1 hypothetical protein Aca07nite_77350 [Actinoplanes capillaceus]
MNGDEDDTMTPVEQNLVWLGYEDYTGLWQVAIEVQDESGENSEADNRAFAQRIVESLLNRGWIELYFTEGPWTNETIMPVPAEDRAEVLTADASWATPVNGGKLIWFGTTDEGFAAYQEAVGW